MIFKDISFDHPQENILYDEVLLSLAEEGKSQEVLRFWESKSKFVVLGRIGKLNDDVHKNKIDEDQIPVFRRASGGGTVLQGPGCLNFTLILSKEKNPKLNDLRESYKMISGRIAEVFKTFDIDVVFKEPSDLAVAKGEMKFSGNAQKRGRKFILHHGTILYDFDLADIDKYLKMPKIIPPYRQRRKHLSFVANVPVSPRPLKEAFKKVFKISADEGFKPDEKQLLESLISSKDISV